MVSILGLTDEIATNFKLQNLFIPSSDLFATSFFLSEVLYFFHWQTEVHNVYTKRTISINAHNIP